MASPQGYLISFVGVIVLILGLQPVYSKVEFLQLLSQRSLTVSGLIIVIVGVALVIMGGSNKRKEVPIYHGKEIVGYRRI